MKVVAKHFIAIKQGGVLSRFSVEKDANSFAGESGTVTPVETAYVFDSLKEKELFETRAMRFSEEVAALNLKFFPSEKGFKILDALIQEKGIENVSKLLHRSIVKTDMEMLLKNRLGEAKIETVIQVLWFEDENDFLKFRQFGKKSLAVLKEWLKKNGLELGMFITE